VGSLKLKCRDVNGTCWYENLPAADDEDGTTPANICPNSETCGLCNETATGGCEPFWNTCISACPGPPPPSSKTSLYLILGVFAVLMALFPLAFFVGCCWPRCFCERRGKIVIRPSAVLGCVAVVLVVIALIWFAAVIAPVLKGCPVSLAEGESTIRQIKSLDDITASPSCLSFTAAHWAAHHDSGRGFYNGLRFCSDSG
jgi:hypothetical protein